MNLRKDMENGDGRVDRIVNTMALAEASAKAVTPRNDDRERVDEHEKLRETDTLPLREARHRISNNLQIVAGLLLQTIQRSDGDAGAHLQAAYSRVMAIAALERSLAESQEETVDLRGYLTQLCGHIADAAIADPARVSFRVFVDDVSVSGSKAASLGMIVVELVVNALKHAFPKDRPGNITVAYDAAGEDWALTVSDNGVGIPVEAPPPGLGTEIVGAIARQLGAHVHMADAFPGRITSVSSGKMLTAVA